MAFGCTRALYAYVQEESYSDQRVMIITYHRGNKEIEDVPAIFPEQPKFIDPFNEDLHDENDEGDVVKNIQENFDPTNCGTFHVGNL